MGRKVLVSGAGIAGPALALAMRDQGHQVTVVERASAVCLGGQSVDFRGPVHRKVLDCLGLWDPLWKMRTSPDSLAFVNEKGKVRALIPAVLTAGDLEVVRGELSAFLHEQTKGFTEYRFNEHVVKLEHAERSTRVAFASGRKEEFDLVVGADGLHSGIRALAMASEAQCVSHHGYGLATFSFRNFLDLSAGSPSYAEPGRSITVSAERNGRARAPLGSTYRFHVAPNPPV